MKRTIAGKNYQFQEIGIPIKKLRFWPGNPRVYESIHSRYGGRFSKLSSTKLQEKIYEEFKKRSDIHELQRHIESEGLAEPLIVRKNSQSDTYDVLEGNRRLAACLIMKKKNKSNKQTESSLACEVVPKKFPENHISTLLSTLHVPGKLPWRGFAKASFVTRRFKALKKEKNSQGAALEKTKEEFSATKHDVEMFIENINLMEWAEENNTEKYSFYDVLNRDRVVRVDLRNPRFRRRWVSSIRTWRKQANLFRSAIKAVVKDPEALEKFRKGNLSLEEAAQQAEDSGSTNAIYQRVKKFRISIKNAESSFRRMEGKDPVLPRLKSEFEDLKALTEDIIEILSKKND